MEDDKLKNKELYNGVKYLYEKFVWTVNNDPAKSPMAQLMAVEMLKANLVKMYAYGDDVLNSAVDFGRFMNGIVEETTKPR